MFALAILIESLSYTINLNTGRFFRDLDKIAKEDTAQIERAQYLSKQGMPTKPNVWHLFHGRKEAYGYYQSSQQLVYDYCHSTACSAPCGFVDVLDYLPDFIVAIMSSETETL